MVSYPLKLDFIEKKEVLLNTNPLTDKSIIKTADYLKYFLPFGADVGVIEGAKNVAIVETSSLPITMFMDRPPVYEIVFSKNYAEKFDWLMAAFQILVCPFGGLFLLRQCRGRNHQGIARQNLTDLFHAWTFLPHQADKNTDNRMGVSRTENRYRRTVQLLCYRPRQAAAYLQALR